MTTLITTFAVEKGIHGKLGFSIKDRRCGDCGAYVPSRFSWVCPTCGKDFTEALHDYVPKGAANVGRNEV